VERRDADRLILCRSEADAEVCRGKIRLQSMCSKFGLARGRHISVPVEFVGLYERRWAAEYWVSSLRHFLLLSLIYFMYVSP
jgi:hypothetical protein